MKRWGVALLLLLLGATTASAWNNKGHMVVARLAWKELKPAERAKVLDYLSKHPHYEEYLKAQRPDNIPEDEWVFLRAATWADWVRPGSKHAKEFHIGERHYINLPYLPEKTDVKPPELPAVHIMKQLALSQREIKAGGSQERRAVELCWLFHLVGDIHQPLHCITLYGDTFPDGDRGGNRSLVKIEGRTIQLHRFWDGLLGTSTTLASLGSSVLEIEKLLQKQPGDTENQLKQHQTPEDWAKESFEVGKRVAYRNGKLMPANADESPAAEKIPPAPERYAEDCGEAARYCIYKAGKRLAMVLRAVLQDN